MAYDRKKIFEQAKNEAKNKKLIWIEEIIAFIPISKFSFYEFFPIGSNEYNELKAIIEDNKINLKASMRKKWYESENATLQVALMKLIGSHEERQILCNSDITTKGEPINQQPIIVEHVAAGLPVTTEELPNESQ
jgi:hypothetical protein